MSKPWQRATTTPMPPESKAELVDLIRRITSSRSPVLPQLASLSLSSPAGRSPPTPVRPKTTIASRPSVARQPSRSAKKSHNSPLQSIDRHIQSQIPIARAQTPKPDPPLFVRVGPRLIGQHVDQSYQYRTITEQEAHPPLPAILFRCYDATNQGLNGPQGFVAGRYITCNSPIAQAPHCSDPVLFSEIENHMNRNPVASPFVSTATELFWIIRLALKGVQAGKRNIHISLINAEKLGTAYYPPPYHKELTNKRVFTKGAWNYVGKCERLIWATIPPSAILRDMHIDELLHHVSASPVMSAAMQLDCIGTNRVGLPKLRKHLKQAPVSLDHRVTEGLASLLLLFGATALTPALMITKLVSDVVQGWDITLDADSPSRWAHLAGFFAYVITNDAGVRLRVDDACLRALGDAFLAGLRWSLMGPVVGGAGGGVDGDAVLLAEKRMQRKAVSIGLGSEWSSSGTAIDSARARRDALALSAATGHRCVMSAVVVDSPLSHGSRRVQTAAAAAAAAAGSDEEDDEERRTDNPQWDDEDEYYEVLDTEGHEELAGHGQHNDDAENTDDDDEHQRYEADRRHEDQSQDDSETEGDEIFWID
ncbi:hypothetical protein AAFC00_006408 [Neodothiora populina]